ncbi:GNAT family protein [Chitinophaga sp. MM2321]|uniref:GNAT family N-acetyltransferase n=1 Tax=Chitinophaga sp. MM2321 TaxID=3137178 RepID=UPI0032D57356
MQQLPETFPVLHTPALDLIGLTSQHAIDLFQLFNDKRVTEFYNVVPLDSAQDAAKIIDYLNRRFKDKLGIRWGIALKGQQRIIGTIGFNSFPQANRAVIVYALAYDQQRRGLMTEAIQEIIRYGFQELHINRIEAEVMPGNTASEKVLAKTGFRHEGFLREWMLWEDKYYDINMWAILKRDKT